MAYQRVSHSSPFSDGSSTDAAVVVNAIEVGLEAAETTIASHTTSIATNATAITTETTRAKAAETNGLAWSRGYGRFANIAQTLSEGTDSFAMAVLSDSTGVGTTRWPYLAAQSLATSYPAYTVEVRNWNDTNQSFDAPTAIQTGTAGSRYVTFAGTYSLFSEGDDTTLNGVIDVRLKLTLASWTPASQIALVSRYFSGSRVFSLQMTTAGLLSFFYTLDGNNQQGGYSSTVATGFSAGTTNWIRCVFTPDNGSNQNTYQYYTSSDGVTWTQLGTTVTVSGAVTLYQPPTNADATYAYAGYEVGGRGLSGTLTPSGTNFYEVEIRNGLNGALVAPRYLEHWGKNTSSSATLNGAPILTILNGSVSGKSLSYFNETQQLSSTPTALTATGGTSGTNVISFALVSGVAVGMTVTGTGVPASTTITSFTSTSITLSANLTTTASGSYTFSIRGTSTINMSSTTGLSVGQTVIAVGVPNNTTITSISGTLITLSNTIATYNGTDNYITFTPSSRLPLICSSGYDIRTVFVADSHNMGGWLGKYVWGRWNSVIKQIKTRLPQVPITVIAQNPQTSAASYYNEHNRRCKMMANIAAANDASFIDVYQAFRNSSTALSSLINSDGVHPSDASGSPLWRDTVLAFLTNKA